MGGDSRGLCDHFPVAQKITADPLFEKTQFFVNSPFSSKTISKIYISSYALQHYFISIILVGKYVAYLLVYIVEDNVSYSKIPAKSEGALKPVSIVSIQESHIT